MFSAVLDAHEGAVGAAPDAWILQRTLDRLDVLWRPLGDGIPPRSELLDIFATTEDLNLVTAGEHQHLEGVSTVLSAKAMLIIGVVGGAVGIIAEALGASWGGPLAAVAVALALLGVVLTVMYPN